MRDDPQIKIDRSFDIAFQNSPWRLRVSKAPTGEVVFDLHWGDKLIPTHSSIVAFTKEELIFAIRGL